jgi:NAD(P)-dependent dehydrogenase (short-subunit alcohol dehydrogenase family)
MNTQKDNNTTTPPAEGKGEASNCDLTGKVAVVTGGGGVLGGSIAKSLAMLGVKVVVLGRTPESIEARAAEIALLGGEAMAVVSNVVEMGELKKACAQIVEKWGTIDILVNCAGGNIAGANIRPDQTIFDMNTEAWEKVLDLNQNGTVYPCLVFGEVMAKSGKGSIINISSMATYSAITRVPGYSVAKTGMNIFTQWLATELAQKFGEGLRVNAIAPGFFIGDQNRDLLINPDGSYTDRSKKIMDKTPMGRFGDITELNGLVQFLCSDAASFITGAIIPVDGGFSAYSGV